jgi:predicted TIM-barrel fold metal-dependent hydrolase
MSTTHLHKAAAAAAAGRRNGNVMQLPEWVKLPASVALPHGSFEAALRAPLNRDMAAQLQDLAGRIAAAAVEHPGNPDACAAELEQIR